MHPRWTLILMLLVVAVGTACAIGGDGEPDATATALASLSPREILDRAIDSWGETNGARFALEIDGETYLDEDETIRLLSAEGELSRPASVRADAAIRASVVSVNVSLIFIGDEVYMTDIITGTWGPAPGDFTYDPAVLLDNEDGLAAAIDAMESPELVEDNDDQSSPLHISATLPSEAIDTMTASALDGELIDVDVWIDRTTFDLTRIRLAEQHEESDDPVVWTIEITDHGEEFVIESPDVS